MKKLLFIAFAMLTMAISFSCKDKDNFSEEEQAKIDKQLILDYAQEHNYNLTEGPEGLYYMILTPGTGTAHPTAQTVNTMHYQGTLLDGTIFDSSYGKPPLKFYLNQVIRGWQLGVPLMLKGEKTKFFIPSALAYGRYGQGGIPENAVLIFDMELVNF